MSNKLREQVVRYKLDKQSVYYVDLKHFENEDVLYDKLAAILFQAGCIVILNNNGIGDREFISAGRKIKQLCAEFDGTLIVCSRADLALLSEADGILLKDSDISLEQAHSLLSEDAIIGAVAAQEDVQKFDFILYDKTLSVVSLEKNIDVESLLSE